MAWNHAPTGTSKNRRCPPTENARGKQKKEEEEQKTEARRTFCDATARIWTDGESEGPRGRGLIKLDVDGVLGVPSMKTGMEQQRWEVAAADELPQSSH